MSVRIIPIHSATDGSFSYERDFKGTVRALEVIVGTLDTPDIAITDGIYGTSVYSGSGLSADTLATPDVVVMGTLKVAVTGAGATKRGRINLLVTT
jgi:hypothetical protein